MRWLVLDEIIEIRKGREATAHSHIPQGPVSCQPLFLEMMAQTAALLLGAEDDFASDVVFAKVESACFYPERRSHPDHVLQVRVEAESLRSEGAWFEGTVRQGEGLLAEGRFLLMKVSGLRSETEKPVSFHEAFMNHFSVRDKVRL